MAAPDDRSDRSDRSEPHADVVMVGADGLRLLFFPGGPHGASGSNPRSSTTRAF